MSAAERAREARSVEQANERAVRVSKQTDERVLAHCAVSSPVTTSPPFSPICHQFRHHFTIASINSTPQISPLRLLRNLSDTNFITILPYYCHQYGAIRPPLNHHLATPFTSSPPPLPPLFAATFSAITWRLSHPYQTPTTFISVNIFLSPFNINDARVPFVQGKWTPFNQEAGQPSWAVDYSIPLNLKQHFCLPYTGSSSPSVSKVLTNLFEAFSY